MRDITSVLLIVVIVIGGTLLYLQMDAQRKQIQHMQEAWVDATEITNEALSFYDHENEILYQNERTLDKIQHDPLDSPVHDDVKQLLMVS